VHARDESERMPHRPVALANCTVLQLLFLVRFRDPNDLRRLRVRTLSVRREYFQFSREHLHDALGLIANNGRGSSLGRSAIFPLIGHSASATRVQVLFSQAHMAYAYQVLWRTHFHD